jgi:hypothetical protein
MRSIILGKRATLWTAIYSACLSVTFVIGGKIDFGAAVPFEQFTYKDIVNWALLSFFIYVVLINIVKFLFKQKWFFFIYKSKTKIWLFSVSFILICWLPYFLSYYPGNLSADSFSTINQITGVLPMGNHHPVFFTIFVKALYTMGLFFAGSNFGVAFYSMTQMLILASVLSYSIYWFAKKGIPIYILILITVFFALNPVIAMYSITMWKDVLFGGWILLLVLALYDVAESGGALLGRANGLIKLFALCLVIAFFRNNGIYIVFAVLGTVLVCYRKKIKILLPAFSGLLIVILLIQGPVYNIIGIEKGPFAESIGIPLQQVCYTVKYGGKLTEEQETFLNELIPAETVKNVYQPDTVDPIKFNTKFNHAFLEKNKVHFIKTWVEIFPDNAIAYMKAYLMETQGYYHIGTTNWLCYFGISQGGNGEYYSTDLADKLFHLNLQDNIEGLIGSLDFLYSIAAMVWLAFLNCVILIISKRMQFIIALVPLLVLWLTLMAAAPTFCEFRYMFSFLLAVPFLVVTLFIQPNRKNDDGIGAQ